MNYPKNILVQKFFARNLSFANGLETAPVGVLVMKSDDSGESKVLRVAFALRNVALDPFDMAYLTDVALARIEKMATFPNDLQPINVPFRYWHGRINDSIPRPNDLYLNETVICTKTGQGIYAAFKERARLYFKDCTRTLFYPQICVIKYPLKMYGMLVQPADIKTALASIVPANGIVIGG